MTATRGEGGSATVVMIGLVGVVVVLGLLVADAAVHLRGRMLAVTAADAAALAAAPVTFHGFGTAATPEAEAVRFATANGAVLDRCACPVDRTWRRRTVTVTVSVTTSLFLFGDRTVDASSTAEFTPIRIAQAPARRPDATQERVSPLPAARPRDHGRPARRRRRERPRLRRRRCRPMRAAPGW